MVMIFENLKKSWCICKCCVVVYLPTTFEKDWPTLLPDCFAWFSHRQALNMWVIFQLYQDKNKDDVRFVLDLHAELDFYCASSLKTVCGKTCRSNRTHYPYFFVLAPIDSKTTLLKQIRLVGRSQKYNFLI